MRLTDELPKLRLVLVDQFMDRVAMEREPLLQDIAGAPPEFREALRDLQPVLESVERILAPSKEKDPDAEPFDINEYRFMVEAENRVIDRLFLQLTALMVIFFALLLGFRVTSARLNRDKSHCVPWHRHD